MRLPSTVRTVGSAPSLLAAARVFGLLSAPLPHRLPPSQLARSVVSTFLNKKKKSQMLPFCGEDYNVGYSESR